MLAAFLFAHIPLVVEEFARGGGGGSGGGGGGGSGGGGGGGILYLIGVIGYLPMHFLGAMLRKRLYKEHWLGARIVGWTVAVAIVLALIVIVFMTRSFLLAFYVCAPIAVGAVLGMGAGLNAWAGKINKNAKARAAVATYAAKDNVWNEKNILRYVEGIFYTFQKDWSYFNVTSMQRYMSPNYYNHTNLMMTALQSAHRVNRVNDPQITSHMIVSAFDSDKNDQDTFEVSFTAFANDQLFDDRTNSLLFVDKNSFTETWRFIRRDNTWLLDGIRQSTESAYSINSLIMIFALQHGFYYSADWGWLLLPADGYLFSNGKFGTSDINNHVIGVVDNVLTQLYTYTPNPNNGSMVGIDQYLVVQTNVPKSYGRILVRRRSKFINWPVKGLTQVKMEWGEFNAMYDVYASDLERVTSFELLNPAFMAVLRDLPFEVNIEVVDNVVYLFTKGSASEQSYAMLYEIVLKAHKEMQL